MPKRNVLRCERNWVLESESGKEEHWLVIAELGDVLEKVLIDFGKLFQRREAVRLYERLDILREEVVDGRRRVRWLEEQVEPAGLILISDPTNKNKKQNRRGQQNKRTQVGNRELDVWTLAAGTELVRTGRPHC